MIKKRLQSQALAERNISLSILMGTGIDSYVDEEI